MKPKIKKLSNGLRIVTVPMPDNPTVTVMVMVAAGTRYETAANNGLSHFLEHMCFKGTKTRTNIQIAYEMEAMGAESNAFTSYDYTGYYAKGRSELFPKLLDLVSDIYLHSTFPESEITKEAGVITGEIDMIEDAPQSRVGYLFLESLYGNQPAGMPILGTKETVRSFTRDDFVNYHNQHYIAEKTVVVVAGNVSHADVVRRVARAFAEIKSGRAIAKKKIAKSSGPRVMVRNKKTDQAHLVMGCRSLPTGHPDEPAFAVMTALLGQGSSSRLFIKLREEMGAGYYVFASHTSSNDSGEFDISTGTDPARVPEIIRAIRGEIQNIRTDLVSAEELAKTKEYLIGRIVMGLESSDAFAHYAGVRAVLGRPIKPLAAVERDIRAVTAADVLRVAKKYLKNGQLHLAVKGPHDDIGEIDRAMRE